MKKIITLALVLAMVLSALCVTAYAAEPEKKFVIDGNLDVWYLSADETPADDLNYYHWTDLEAYNRDPTNGHGVYFYDDPETAAEVWMAHDDTYVYVFVKCWDENIAKHPEDTGVSMQSDSIEIWFDPDPNSQTTKPDGSPQDKPDGVNFPDFPTCTSDPNQGDNRFRIRGSDFAVGDFHNVTKPNYGCSTPEWFRNTDNCRGFYFENEEKATLDGDILTSGFGVEVRFPRYDETGGNCYRVNVACNNYQGEDQSTWYALAMGSSWWLDYSTANQVIYPEEGNPHFDQDVSEKSMWYSESECNAAGIAVKDAIEELPSRVTALEKAQVESCIAQYNALDDVQKGYVKARNYQDLADAAATLGLEFDGNQGGTQPEPGPDDDPGDDPQPTAVKMGDVNGDEKVDAKDALEALKISVAKITPTDDQKTAADVDEDGKVAAKDALEILKFVVKKPSALDKFQ